MTSGELAKFLGCSRQWIFFLRRKFPEQCPRNFDDVEGWRNVLTLSRSKARVPYTRDGTKAKLNGEPLSELSDIQRLTRNRADKVAIEREILEIELAVARRQAIPEGEIVRVFERIAAILRAKVLRLKNDLPASLLGLDAAGIDRVLTERFEETFSSMSLPADFFQPKGALQRELI